MMGRANHEVRHRILNGFLIICIVIQVGCGISVACGVSRMRGSLRATVQRLDEIETILNRMGQ